MSQNTRELTLLGVIRQFFGSSVQIVVAVFTLPLVWLFGHGNQQKGFLGTIIVFGAISLVLILNTLTTFESVFKSTHCPPAGQSRVNDAAAQSAGLSCFSCEL